MQISTIKRIRSTIVLILLVSLFFVKIGHAHTTAVALNSETQRRVINQIEYLNEKQPLNHLEASSEANASLWQSMTGSGFNFGNFHPPFWIRFDVINIDHVANDWQLEMGQPLLDQLEVVAYNHATRSWSNIQKTGNLVPLDQRTIRQRGFVFPLNLPPGERTTVYARVASVQGLYLTADIWQKQAFREHSQERSLLLGLFLGTLMVMVLYNLSLYIFTRDTNYLAYTAYVMAVVLYEVAATGIGAQYLWDRSIWLRANSYLIFASLSFLAGTIFIRKFLSLKQYGGWLLLLNNVFLIYWAAVTVLCPFMLSKTFLEQLNMVALISPLVAMVTCVYLWIKGNAQAKYYTIAYLFVDAGTVIMMMGYAGIITRGLITEYSQMVGFVIELVLLSLALADRINRDRAEREEAQRIALDLSQKVSKAREEKLMVQEQILEVQRRSNEDLELRVLERTHELERAMNNLELANKELSKLSFTDPLTKVYNRRYFDEILTTEIKRAARTQQHLSVAVIDIDHFKVINDNHGHLIGDECLRLVAKTMSQQLERTGDLLARFGGEEFAVILPATHQANALIVAERIRIAVESIHFIHRSQRIKLRVSVGVAGWIPKRDEKNDRMIDAADNALYQAKRTGRNRAVAAIG